MQYHRLFADVGNVVGARLAACIFLLFAGGEPNVRPSTFLYFRRLQWLAEPVAKAVLSQRVALCRERRCRCHWRGTETDRTAMHRPHKPVPAGAGL